MCTGFVHNAGQLYGTRFLLGLAEGGVLPAVSFFISRFYNRHQLTFRYVEDACLGTSHDRLADLVLLGVEDSASSKVCAPLEVVLQH